MNGTRIQREYVSKKSVIDLLDNIPQDCIYNVYLFVKFILSKCSIDAEAMLNEKRKANIKKYFGSLPHLADGLELQKRMRNE